MNYQHMTVTVCVRCNERTGLGRSLWSPLGTGYALDRSLSWSERNARMDGHSDAHVFN